MNEHCVKEVEQIIGYVFLNKEILISALTHSSYTNEHLGNESYERLEYIGDSVVSFIVAKYLYDRYPYANQGFLSKIRSIIISERSFAEVIETLDLDKYLRVSDTLFIISPRLRGDIFESIVGAIYIDSNDISKCKDFILGNLSKRLNANYNVDNITDYKSSLFEYAAKNGLKLDVHTEKLSDMPPVFRASILLNGENVGVGEGNSKKRAEQNASKMVFLERRFSNQE